MSDGIKISNSEWQVMKILWEQSPLTVGEIAKELQNKVRWSKKTITTLLRRLSQKQIISYHDGRHFKYYPMVEKSDAIKVELDDMIDRVFESSPKELMINLVENENFTKEDIEDLKKLLNSINKE